MSAQEAETVTTFHTAVIRLLTENNNLLKENNTLMKENKALLLEANAKLHKIVVNTS